jgi:hypothetical protein
VVGRRDASLDEFCHTDTTSRCADALEGGRVLAGERDTVEVGNERSERVRASCIKE